MIARLIEKNICNAVASDIPKISVYVDSLTHEEKAEMTSEALDVNAEIISTLVFKLENLQYDVTSENVLEIAEKAEKINNAIRIFGESRSYMQMKLEALEKRY